MASTCPSRAQCGPDMGVTNDRFLSDAEWMGDSLFRSGGADTDCLSARAFLSCRDAEPLIYTFFRYTTAGCTTLREHSGEDAGDAERRPGVDTASLPLWPTTMNGTVNGHDAERRSVMISLEVGDDRSSLTHCRRDCRSPRAFHIPFAERTGLPTSSCLATTVGRSSVQTFRLSVTIVVTKHGVGSCTARSLKSNGAGRCGPTELSAPESHSGKFSEWLSADSARPRGARRASDRMIGCLGTGSEPCEENDDPSH